MFVLRENNETGSTIHRHCDNICSYLQLFAIICNYLQLIEIIGNPWNCLKIFSNIESESLEIHLN